MNIKGGENQVNFWHRLPENNGVWFRNIGLVEPAFARNVAAWGLYRRGSGLTF